MLHAADTHANHEGTAKLRAVPQEQRFEGPLLTLLATQSNSAASLDSYINDTSHDTLKCVDTSRNPLPVLAFPEIKNYANDIKHVWSTHQAHHQSIHHERRLSTHGAHLTSTTLALAHISLLLQHQCSHSISGGHQYGSLPPERNITRHSKQRFNKSSSRSLEHLSHPCTTAI